MSDVPKATVDDRGEIDRGAFSCSLSDFFLMVALMVLLIANSPFSAEKLSSVATPSAPTAAVGRARPVSGFSTLMFN